MSMKSQNGSREIEEKMANLMTEQNGMKGAKDAVGDEELEQFRMEWEQEVKSRRSKPSGAQQPQGQAPSHQAALSPDTKSHLLPNSSGVKGKEVEVSQGSITSPRMKASSSGSTKSISPVTSPLTIRRGLPDEIVETRLAKSPERTRVIRGLRGRVGGDAVSIYARAVEAEQGGQLNDALNLYRQAFKMDDNVDRAYSQRRSKPIEEPITPTSLDLVSASAPEHPPFSFQRTIQTAPDYETPHHDSSSSHHTQTPSSSSRPPSILTSIYNSLPEPSISHRPFLPADENLPIPVTILPPEILDHIFYYLDVSSLENFGSTAWRARYLTSISEVWRSKCERIYSKPPVNPGGLSMGDLGKRYGGEWRTCLIEQERIRMDGCYIAVCHYVRPGAGDEWVTITHMITYHRFLRFYPDGTVISFLTTDHPSDVVPLLRPTLRSKGLHIGTYTLLPPDTTENTNPSSNKSSGPNTKKRSTILITDLLEPGSVEPKYEFEMELSLRETSRGKWNKLDILDYRSINLQTGEVLGLALKHQKPFYFSNAVVSTNIVAYIASA